MLFINLTIINIVFEAMDTGKWKKKILVHNSRTYRKFRRNLKGKKTIIAIAHRLKTLKNCTKIIYIKEGKLADIGTLEELEIKFKDFHKLIELSKF